MEVDSNVSKTSPEIESRELGAIPKTYQKIESCQAVEKVIAVDSPITDEVIKKFMDIVFFADFGTDGVYMDNLFQDNEKKRILKNDVGFSRLIKNTLANPNKKPDVKELIQEARRIITEQSSAKLLENKLLGNEPDIIPSESSENVEKNLDVQNLHKIPEKENLPLAKKALQSPEEMEIQQEESPNLDNSSSRKMGELKAAASDSITVASPKMFTKPQTTSQIEENRNEQRSVIQPKYIKQVLQHLNSKLRTTFSVTDPVNLDLDFAYSRQDTGMMMELLNYSHTVLNKIRKILKVIPVCELTKNLEPNLKRLISGREGTRSAIKTLGYSSSTPLKELSKYYTEIIKVLISECAYFLRLQDKLKKVADKLEKDSASTRSKKSRARKILKQSPQPLIDDKISPKSSSEADNRKRRKYPSKREDASPSKYALVNTPYSSTSTAEDASNSPVCSPTKRPRLPSEDSGSPVQMAESSSWVENVQKSSDSEENKY